MLNQKTAFLESIEFIPKFTESYVYYASMKKTSRGNYEVNFKKIAQPKKHQKTNRQNVIKRTKIVSERGEVFTPVTLQKSVKFTN